MIDDVYDGNVEAFDPSHAMKRMGRTHAAGKHDAGAEPEGVISHPDQVIDVFNLHLHSEYGFTIRMDDIMDDPRRLWAYRAGGELLARFGMPTRFGAATEQLRTAARDMRGNLIPDISDLEDKKAKRNAEIARKLASGEWSIVETEEGQYLRSNR